MRQSLWYNSWYWQLVPVIYPNRYYQYKTAVSVFTHLRTRLCLFVYQTLISQPNYQWSWYIYLKNTVHELGFFLLLKLCKSLISFKTFFHSRQRVPKNQGFNLILGTIILDQGYSNRFLGRKKSVRRYYLETTTL